MKILVLGSHPAHIEAGCGGTMNKFVVQGHSIFYRALSKQKKSVQSSDPLIDEMIKSCNNMRIIDYALVNLSFSDFTVQQQKIQERLVEMRENINPDIVFIPSSYNSNEDGRILNQQAIPAFDKHCSILGYELVVNSLEKGFDFFIPISEQDLEKKIECLHMYETQRSEDFTQKGAVKSLASVRGQQCDYKNAEAFEIIQYILK